MASEGGKQRAALPPMARLHVWQIQAVRDVLLIGAVFGLVWVGYAMRTVTVPLLVALTLAYLFEPLVARLTRHPRISRPLAVGGLLLTFGGAAVVALAIIVPLVIGQSLQFVEEVRLGQWQARVAALREYIPQTYQSDFDRAVQWLGPVQRGEAAPGGARESSQPPPIGTSVAPIPGTAAPGTAKEIGAGDDDQRVRQIVREELAAQEIEAGVDAGASAASSSWLTLARRGGRAALSLLGAVAQLGLLAFLIPFYFYFFSVSYPAVQSFARDLLPRASRGRTLELVSKMDRAVAGFVRGRIVICAIIGVLLAIGWAICGVPYAIALGLLIGVFSAVPFLGGIGVPAAVALLWYKQTGLPEAEQLSILWVVGGPVLVFLIVQLVENYVLIPVIAGKATNLDPVTILVAVLAGGSVGGVYGMILAIPVAACGKILITDVLLPRIKAWTHGKAADPLPFDGGG